MRFSNLFFALVASSTIVMAAPAKEDVAVQNAADGNLNTQGCPNGWTTCGECNGTSCKIAGHNWECRQGTSCTAQSGGGDGKLCGKNSGIFNSEKPECPGRN